MFEFRTFRKVRRQPGSLECAVVNAANLCISYILLFFDGCHPVYLRNESDDRAFGLFDKLGRSFFFIWHARKNFFGYYEIWDVNIKARILLSLGVAIQ